MWRLPRVEQSISSHMTWEPNSDPVLRAAMRTGIATHLAASYSLAPAIYKGTEARGYAKPAACVYYIV